jgi:hypothetical protein
MAEQDPKLYSELAPKTSVNIGRRRVITGMGTLAAVSWLPFGIRAQITILHCRSGLNILHWPEP